MTRLREAFRRWWHRWIISEPWTGYVEDHEATARNPWRRVRRSFRQVARGWWHRWIVADDETSELLDRWDREARGHIDPGERTEL